MSYLRTTFILLFISFVTLSSCSKDDEGPSTARAILEGRWKIALFSQNGTAVNDFNGYEFDFTDNGVVTGTRSGSPTVTGSWSIRNDDDEAQLLLNFGSNTSFMELNEDWRVINTTSSKVQLEHSSGSSSGTDLLTFQKL
ncbi:hypothetical protein [Desertivirga arenae]|uniref:hypothetical protein n=1 Tax=Desertivirga arenae TaxID=2810309 RepID=UPI001A95F963|nr:hypothetical protein [Pedobacter sp. SYSU D00823]